MAYLTSAEAARQLHLGRKALLRAVARGELLPATRTPHGYARFHAADVSSYADQLTARAGASNSTRQGVESTENETGASGSPSNTVIMALTRLAALAFDARSTAEAMVSEILALLAESLAVGATLLARVEGTKLHIERVHDRSGMRVLSGAALPLSGTFCSLLQESASRSLVVEDTLADPKFAGLSSTSSFGIGAYSGVPLRWVDGRFYGTLCAVDPAARQSQQGELELLALAGRVIMQSVERFAADREQASLTAHLDDLRRAATISALVASRVDLHSTLERIVRAAARSAGLRHLSVLLLDPSGRTLRHAASIGLSSSFKAAIDGDVIGPSAGTCGVAAHRGKAVITEDLRTDPHWDAYRHLAQPHGFRAVWSLPLHAEHGHVLGTIAAYRKKPGRPTDNQREVLELYARLAAIAVENARADTALRASEERLRVVVSNAPVVLFAVDLNGVYTLAEGRGLLALGRRPEDVVGSSFFERYRLHPAVLATVRRALAGESLTLEVEIDGSVFETRYTPLRDAGDAITGVIGVATDITERRQMEEDLRHQARHDALTGLPNRTFLLERLQDAMTRAARDGASLALCLLDLDRFKEINDTLGHQIGDQLLCQVAERLTQLTRTVDTVARLGGDEFAIVLYDMDIAEASEAAAAIGAALDDYFPLGEHSLHIGASIGVAVSPAHGRDGGTLFRHADVAMYAAKHGGRPGHALYDPAQDAALPARLGLISELRWALRDGALQLYYQPKIALGTGRIIGVEALARWLHPLHGFIPPDQFIPLAEGTGLIGSLTEWALETAIRQCSVWRVAGYSIVVAVNLSAATVHDPQFPRTVDGLLRSHDVPARSLRLEVTESALMADPGRAGTVLTALAALGVGISVDDFGTGYSSLAYLKRLPVDELKIDRSFIQHLTVDDADRMIVSSTIGLGHSLGLTVVAEGVEDRQTQEALLALGCDSVQGFYLGRPMPAPDLDRWLHEHRQGTTSDQLGA